MICVRLAAAALAGLPAAAHASEVVVMVTGGGDGGGEVACRLYSSPAGFPGAAAALAQQRVPQGRTGAVCRFTGLAPGTYAVVAALLPRGQADITRDVLGRPKQPWGVSNNVRPNLRAPRFPEAAFAVGASGVVSLQIRLAR